MRKQFITWLMVIFVIAFMSNALAANSDSYELSANTVNTGKDNGYSGNKSIGSKDIHYGWTLGRFLISGYTSIVNDPYDPSSPIILVNPGDGITLTYQLTQNIDKLNNKDNLSISNDTNGYDAWMESGQKPKDGIGRGALLVKYTNYKNQSRVIPYLDYLTAVKNKTIQAKVSGLQEGDYAVALDYEIAEKTFPLPGPNYHNYRATTHFRIRNSNCMLYLRDLSNKSEMPNFSVAEHGFFLEYTSFYQQIIVRRDILTDNGNGYTLTPRACKAAADGAQYTDTGIYTVTVKNIYTGESVEQKIAVGQDALTNAYVVSQCAYTPETLSNMVASGQVTIGEDWRIKALSNAVPIATHWPVPNPQTSAPQPKENNIPIIVGSVAAVGIIGLLFALFRRKTAKPAPVPTPAPVPVAETVVEPEQSEPAPANKEQETALEPSPKDSYAVGATVVFGKSKWYVLANSLSRYLLLMERPVSRVQYHNTDEAVTWEHSSIRYWLNNSYYKYAFSPDEKAMILQLPLRPERNNAWDTDAGSPTSDYVFCLGCREFGKYMPPLVDEEWWTRSPGSSAQEAAVVTAVGKVESRPVTSETVFVRPAIWVDTAKMP